MTEILATMGPTLWSEEQIMQAYNFKTTMFRINLGKRARPNNFYLNNLLTCKAVEQNIKIMVDLPSTRPRVGQLKKNTIDGMMINIGDVVRFVDNEGYRGENREIPVIHLHEHMTELHALSSVIMDDGKIEFSVITVEDDSIIAICKRCLNSIKVDTSITFKDSKITYNLESDFRMLQQNYRMFDIDYLGLSFIKNAKEVIRFRDKINKIFPGVKIISKIETQEAIDDISAITEASDGVMIARGDLAHSIPAHFIPRIQNMIIYETKKYRKISIVATQVFEKYSYMNKYSCSELSDVAYACRNMADYIMLSGESANSKNSIKTLETISHIINYEKNI